MSTINWSSYGGWPAPPKKKSGPTPEPVPELPDRIESKNLWAIADPYYLARAANGTEEFLFRYPKHQSKDEYRQAVTSVAEASAFSTTEHGAFWVETVVPVAAGQWAKARGYRGSSTVIFPRQIHTRFLETIMYVGSQMDTLPAGSVAEILVSSENFITFHFTIPHWPVVRLIFDGWSWMAGATGQIQLKDQIIIQPSLRHYLECARLGEELNKHPMIPGRPSHALSMGAQFTTNLPKHSDGLLEITRGDHILQVNRRHGGAVYFAQDSKLLPVTVEEQWVRYMFDDPQVSLEVVRQAFADCLDASRLPAAD